MTCRTPPGGASARSGGPYAVLAGTFLLSLFVASVQSMPANVVAGVYLAAISSEP